MDAVLSDVADKKNEDFSETLTPDYINGDSDNNNAESGNISDGGFDPIQSDEVEYANSGVDTHSDNPSSMDDCNDDGDEVDTVNNDLSLGHPSSSASISQFMMLDDSNDSPDQISQSSLQSKFPDNDAKGHLEDVSKSLSCVVCDKSFKNVRLLNRHLHTHYESNAFECPECNKCFSRYDAFREHRRIHTGGRPFICPVCKKTFRVKHLLETHFRIHTGEKPYACPHCEKQFNWSSNLSQHIKRHQGIKPHQCQECQKQFPSKALLKIHVRNHTGEKPFTCDVCGMGFTTKLYLKQHVAVHSGDRPWQCKLCDKNYKQKAHLYVHMRTHKNLEDNEIDGNPVYKHGGWCDICKRMFRSSLERHKKRLHANKSFQCTVCEKQFATSDSLEKHMHFHNAERRFVCEHCLKRFIRKTHLTDHLRTHSQMTMKHICTECGKGLGSPQSLQAHMKRHTESKPYHCSVCEAQYRDRRSFMTHMHRHADTENMATWYSAVPL